MSSLNAVNVEYTQWDLMENIVERLLKIIGNPYEVRNAVERLLMSMANVDSGDSKNSDSENGGDCKDAKDAESEKSANSPKQSKRSNWSTVYRSLPRDHPVYKEFEKVLKKLTHLNIMSSSVDGTVDDIFKMINDTIDRPPKTPEECKRRFTYSKTSRVLALLNSASDSSSNVKIDNSGSNNSSNSSNISIGNGNNGNKSNDDNIVKYTTNDVLRMLMRYYTLMADGGQQWGMTSETFERLYARGVRLECFASPLNRKLVGGTAPQNPQSELKFSDGITGFKRGVPTPHYCSLFVDTDAPFGSLGNFFHTDFPTLYAAALVDHGNGSIQLNPPFVEDILLKAAEKSLSYLAWLGEQVPSLSDPLSESTSSGEKPILTFSPLEGIRGGFKRGRAPLVFFHGPDWKDSAYFLFFQSFAARCGDRIEFIPLRRGTYYLEKPSGEIFLSPVDNWYFCLSVMPLSSTDRESIQAIFK